MATFKVYDAQSAPAAARPILESTKKSLGFVPNLYAVFAGSPALLDAYMKVSAQFDRTSLDATERQVVLLSVSAENACDYCVAAHTVISGMQDVPRPVVDAIREGRTIENPKLQALRRLTTAVVKGQGHVDRRELEAFYSAGYTESQVLDVVLGVGMKTLSNYTNHLAGTPLDEAFKPAAWTAPATARS